MARRNRIRILLEGVVAALVVAAVILVLTRALSSSMGTLIVANLQDDSISFIDVETREVQTIRVGDSKPSYPAEPCVVGGKVYITLHNYELKPRGHFLAEIDPATGKQRDLLRFTDDTYMPTEIRHQDGFLYVTDQRGHDRDSDLFRIDLEGLGESPRANLFGNEAVVRIPVGKTSSGLYIDEARKQAIVTNRYSTYVSVVDLESAQEIDQIQIVEGNIGNNLFDVVGHEDWDEFCVSALTMDSVFCVDFEGTTKVRVEGDFAYPAGMAMSGRRNQLYVSNFQSDKVSVVDLATKRVIQEVEVGHWPVEMTLDDSEDTLFVSNWKDGTVSFVDLDSMEEVAVVETGEVPLGLTFTKRMWAAD